MVKILDTTLRDGSYVVDFAFTAADTAAIAGGLDSIGVPFIEIGHGLGLNAGSDPRYASPVPDEAHFEAAAQAVTRGRWGAFLIPGIGRIEDIDRAASFGMSFLRIGTNVTESGQARPFIQRARERDLLVCCNLMKTYALPPGEVATIGANLADWGAQVVSVVDSAGGMLPEDVAAYLEALADRCDVALGFHGHDNLGLAMANALKAVETGAYLVDASLRGIGRSAGNTPTETLVLALMRRGLEIDIDPLRLLDLAEQRIDPLLGGRRPRDSLSVIFGYAQFHSSFLDMVLQQAEEAGVDPRALIIEVSQQDRVAPGADLVRQTAMRLAKAGGSRATPAGLENNHVDPRPARPDAPEGHARPRS